MGTPTMTQPDQDELQIGDLGQAAWLVALGQPLLSIRSNGRRAYFCFPSTARPLAQRYFEGSGEAALVRRFHLCLRDLRGLAREAVER